MAQVLDLVDASAKSHPDGLKALAYELKREATKAESTLRAELNQTAGHKLGLVTAVQIMALTGNFKPLDKIETIFGRVAFDLPTARAADPAPLMKMVANLSKEFSETVQEVAQALKDGVLDPDEAKKCLKELNDLVQVAMEFKATLEHIVNSNL